MRRAFEHSGAYAQRRYYTRWRREAVRAFVGSAHLGRVIDYGCGDGALSLPLLEQADELVLFDPSPVALAQARSRVSAASTKKVTFVRDGIEAWRERPANLVLCVGVLGHVDDSWDCLSEVASLVAPGGALLLELTDASHPIGRGQVWFSRVRAWLRSERYAWNLLRASEVLARCGKLGLTVEGCYRYGLPFHPGRCFSDDFLHWLGVSGFGRVGAPRAGVVVTCERLYYLRRH